ncbi:MAG: GIY-YIG nuclease family protein [Deltaproteobacteria bacterium]|nr:GIY-YIG nuclease family protein [Deltaproteobacteria bacterium]
MYSVYILKCNNGALYTGITNNLEKRLRDHSNGCGSKYVRSHLPFNLVYVARKRTKSAALKRECVIKKMSRAEKMALIKQNKKKPTK